MRCSPSCCSLRWLADYVEQRALRKMSEANAPYVVDRLLVGTVPGDVELVVEVANADHDPLWN